MARTKQTARSTTGGRKKAAGRPAGKKAASGSPKPKAKKPVGPPKVPGNAVLRRLAMAAAPDMEHGVNKEVYTHILQLYVRTLKTLAQHVRKELEAKNAKLAAKDKEPVKNLSFDLLAEVSDLSAEEAEALPTCLSLAKKPAKGAKKITKLDGCLIGPRSSFKKYLIMGSDDGEIKAVFSVASAPKVSAKKGKKAAPPGFRFPKPFLNGLQYAVEREVITQLSEVWEALGEKAKRLNHKAFVAAGMNYGEEPVEKEKKPRKKAEKKEKKEKAEKSGSPKKKKAPAKKGGKGKKAGGKGKGKVGRPKKSE